MVELPKGLQNFIARDLVYLVGGGCVLTSFLYSFNRLPSSDTPIALYLLGAGISYVVGYSLQEGSSVLRIVTTGPVAGKNRLFRKLYMRYTGLPWNDLSGVAWRELRKSFWSEFRDDYEQSAYQRTITLMMVGTTMAPCGIVSAALLLRRWIASKSAFDLALTIAALIFAILLLLVAWLKAAEVSQIDAEMIERYRQRSIEKER